MELGAVRQGVVMLGKERGTVLLGAAQGTRLLAARHGAARLGTRYGAVWQSAVGQGSRQGMARQGS